MPKITDKQIAFGKEPFSSIIKSIERLSHENSSGVKFEQIFNDLQLNEENKEEINNAFLDAVMVDVRRGCLQENKPGKKGRTPKKILSESLTLLKHRKFITFNPKSKPRYYHYLSIGKAQHIRFLDRINSLYRSYEFDKTFTMVVREAFLPRKKAHNESEFCLFGFPSERKKDEIYEELREIQVALQNIQKKIPDGHIAFFWRSFDEIEESHKDFIELRRDLQEKQDWYAQLKKKKKVIK